LILLLSICSVSYATITKDENAIKLFNTYIYNTNHFKSSCSLFPKDLSESQKSQLITKGFQWYQKQADKGNASAMMKIATAYKYGAGVNRNSKKAHALFIKAAKKGNSEAMFSLGLPYLAGRQGLTLQQNTLEAVKWFTKAANAENELAQIYLSHLYEAGPPGIETNPRLAMKWLKILAKHNSGLGNATLADFYFDGTVYPRNFKKALALYQSALSKPDLPVTTKLYIVKQLILMNTLGLGTKKNPEKAKYWQDQIAKLKKDATCSY